MDKARKDAEVVKEKKLPEVKEKFLNKKSELEKEVQQRNQRIQQSENRLKQRELNLNQRQEEISRRRQDVEQQQQRLDNEKKMLQVRHQELDKMQEQEREKLEELSGLSAEEAKTRLVESMKDQARLDAASYVNEIVDEAKLNANQQAKKDRHTDHTARGHGDGHRKQRQRIPYRKRRGEGSHHRPRGPQHPRPGGCLRRRDRRR